MQSVSKAVKVAALLLLAGIQVLLVSCRHEPGPVRSTSNFRMMDDTLIRYNQGASRTEEQEIRDFTARYGWDMIATPTGVRYLVYKQGGGPAAERGKIAVIRYDLKLLSGKRIYTSDSLGLKEFPVGHGEVEAGLQEAIQLMRKGDRAKVIIPSRLAYGLLGDGNLIPPGATLVYDIELVDVKSSPATPQKRSDP